MVATKATSRMGLALHIGTSKHYARIIYRLAKKIKHNYKDQKKLDKELDEGIEKHSIKEVREAAIKLLEKQEKELEELGEVTENDFVLEYRLENSLNELIHDLKYLHTDSNKQDDSDLRKNLSEEVKKDLKALHDLFDEIKGKLIQQKKARRDQRLGWHTVREFTLEWQTLLFHDLKHGSKKVKREISHVKKHLKKLHLVIMALKNNDKVDDKLIKELRNNIHDIKHEMTVEIEQLFKMEKTVVFLLNRLQKDNEEEYKKMTNLGSSGFPTNILEEMEEHEKSYLSVLKKQEKDESIRSKSIIINEKD